MKNVAGNEKPKVVLSEKDYVELSVYLEGLSRGVTYEALAEELDRAEVLADESVPPNVVRLNSRVRFFDRSSGRIREISIVRPERADAAQGRVSFLAPVGAALLGLSAGQEIAWKMPDGRVRSFQVLSVEAQDALRAAELAVA